MAGGLSVAGGLALAWGAVDPVIVRAVPTGGLVLIVAMVALPVMLAASAGATKLAGAGAAEIDAEPAHDAGRITSVGVVRHESHGGDRHERPHTPRSPRARGHRPVESGAVESGDGMTEV